MMKEVRAVVYAESVDDVHERAGIAEVARLLLQLRDEWVGRHQESGGQLDHARFIEERTAMWGSVSKQFLGSTGSMVVGILSTVEGSPGSDHILVFNAIRGWSQARLEAALSVVHEHDRAVANLSLLLTRERGFLKIALPERLEAGDMLVKLLARDPQLRVVAPGLEYYTTKCSDEAIPYCWDIVAAMEQMLANIVAP